jgi:5-amino-6-(5-phospho-D-ribitylamino)uracil phosphatase
LKQESRLSNEISVVDIKQMNKIYISDLDGTLLRNDGVISEFSKNTLKNAIEEGLIFTVASARSVVSIAECLGDLKLKLPVIEFNGAFISDLETGRHEIIHHIDRDLVPDLYQIILDHECLPFIASFNGKEDCVYYQKIINEGMLWYLDDRQKNRDKRLRNTPDLKNSFEDKIICWTIINTLDILKELRLAIDSKFGASVETHLYENRYFTGWYWLTIDDRKATKANAMSILLENYGLKDKEVIVFGDHCNDLSMFQAADRAIAVSNAINQLKEIATEIIGENEDDSVVKYIIRG